MLRCIGQRRFHLVEIVPKKIMENLQQTGNAVNSIQYQNMFTIEQWYELVPFIVRMRAVGVLCGLRVGVRVERARRLMPWRGWQKEYGFGKLRKSLAPSWQGIGARQESEKAKRG